MNTPGDRFLGDEGKVEPGHKGEAEVELDAGHHADDGGHDDNDERGDVAPGLFGGFGEEADGELGGGDEHD